MAWNQFKQSIMLGSHQVWTHVDDLLKQSIQNPYLNIVKHAQDIPWAPLWEDSVKFGWEMSASAIMAPTRHKEMLRRQGLRKDVGTSNMDAVAEDMAMR